MSNKCYHYNDDDDDWAPEGVTFHQQSESPRRGLTSLQMCARQEGSGPEGPSQRASATALRQGVGVKLNRAG